MTERFRSECLFVLMSFISTIAPGPASDHTTNLMLVSRSAREAHPRLSANRRSNGDNTRALVGFALIAKHQADRETVFYIDPPYTLAARRLYPRWEIDHVQLFSVMQVCKGDFLMSYDNTVEIGRLAKSYGFQTRLIAIKSTHHAKMTELLIGKDLSWLSNASS